MYGKSDQFNQERVLFNWPHSAFHGFAARNEPFVQKRRIQLRAAVEVPLGFPSNHLLLQT